MRKIAPTLFTLAVLIFLPLQGKGAERPNRQGIAFFEKKIRPVLVKHCYQCHSRETDKPKGGLLLDTRDGIRKGGETGHAVIPGNVKESLLLAAIKHTGDVSEMPPEKKLPDAVIADFEKWIRMGAPDPRDGKKPAGPRVINIAEGRKFWAFVPPRRTPVPTVKNTAWPRSTIDRYLLAKMEAQGVVPVADADKVTLIRRATFDLTGLPPTPAEIDDFLHDSSPRAFEKVIDRLLASPRFGERWGRHWLDIVRFAESTGKERNYPYPYAWRYRNYVIDSFNADKPYDQFIREQLAGDLLPAKTAAEKDEHLIATGLLAFGPKSLNERNRLKFEMDVVDDQIDVTGRAFLALTIACARCHDHKFDPIPTTDYYALAGIFRSTQVLAGVRGRRARGGTTSGLISLTASSDGRKYERYTQQVKQLQQQLNRYVGQLVRLSKKGRKGKRKLNKKQLQKLLKKLQAPVIRKNDSPEVAKLKTAIKNTMAQLKRLRRNAPPAPPVAMGVQEKGRPVNSRVFIKGDVEDQGETVPRGFVQVATIGEPPKLPADQSGRLQLAEWIASPANPLTARVMVNRIWQHLFGTGLVRTVDNFGQTGQPPSHPELLDYLALQFIDNGWSIKTTIRQMMLTRAYQLSSNHHEKNYNIDGDNRLLWRASRRRLDAEAIRDAILFVSGQLDLQRPAGSPVQKLGQGEIGRQIRLTSLNTSQNCRSVYLPIVRQAMPEVLRVFDVADPSLIVGQREITTVPTQALFMMNNPFVLRSAEAMAKRLFAQKELDDVGRIRLAYRWALGRFPAAAEEQRVLAFLRAQRQQAGEGISPGSARDLDGWAAFCQTLFASAEFRYLY